ncbi:hypothetical protein HN937_29080, partial [Candidatus Poribacteria bacterium]|nr:hypothetical protein [Candidatus Poribacteria bacterium]
MTISLYQPSVETNKDWVSDKWVNQPSLFPVMADDAVGPNIPTAKFRWRYGSVSTDGAAAVDVAPIDLNGHYVRIRRPATGKELRDDPDTASKTIWTGRFTESTDAPGGRYLLDPVDRPETGDQTLLARGLAAELDRCKIYGSVALINGKAERIDTVLQFNISDRRGGAPSGNRSAARYKSPETASTSYIFSDSSASGVEEWRVSDIIEYLIAWFGPAALSFSLAGQTDILDAIVRVVSPAADVAATINRLVDRRSGAAWSITRDLYIYPEIYIRSLLSDDIKVAGAAVEANDSQGDWDVSDEQVKSLTVTRSAEHRYDRIIARGEPVVVCGSATVGSAFDNGWSAAIESAYESAVDSERASDKYRGVFSNYVLKTPTGGTKIFEDGAGSRNGICPSVAANGQLDAAKPSPVLLSEKTLLRQLPILTGYDYSSGSAIQTDSADPNEFMPPFALVKDKIDGADAYGFVDRVAGFDNRPTASGMSLAMLDNAPGFRIKSTPPHRLGKDTFTATEPTTFAPLFDYRQIVATVAIASDVRLQIARNTGSVNAASGDPSKTLIIDVPGAEAHYICPGTVVDCVEGQLVRTPNGITV